MTQHESYFEFPYVAPLENAAGDPLVHEMISRRAYELFEERGRAPGHEAEDWSTAEREIKHHLGL